MLLGSRLAALTRDLAAYRPRVVSLASPARSKTEGNSTRHLSRQMVSAARGLYRIDRYHQPWMGRPEAGGEGDSEPQADAEDKKSRNVNNDAESGGCAELNQPAEVAAIQLMAQE